jgi:hypothetical protein
MSEWPPLRDYRTSRAVVMGTWDYTLLTPVPAARISCQRMARLLTSLLCGWPQDRLVRLANRNSKSDLPDKLIH